MVGIDINASRLRDSMPILRSRYGVRNYETACANVESIPLPSSSFDAALAIDIIEHVEHPRIVMREALRLLVPGGLLLITFPAMHDRYVDAASFAKRLFSRRTSASPSGWNPDAHIHDYPLHVWISLAAESGFTPIRFRATTMFPPFHLVGVPRFWFSNGFIHAVDRFFCSLPVIRNFGQSLMCVFRK